MRDHRTTAELQRIVELGRNTCSRRALASAERELALRQESEEALFERKLNRIGVIAAVIGAVCVLWPALLLASFGQIEMPSGPVDPNEPFVFRHFHTLWLAVGVFQAVCGALLLSGGVALRLRKPIGPWLIDAVIILAMSYVVLFTGSIFPMFISDAHLPISLLFITFSLASAAFWLFLLWLPLRFFSSPRVRESCNSATA